MITSYIYDLPPSPNYTVEEIGTSRPMGKRYRDGVLQRADYCSCVSFVGTAPTLIAAGLVEEHMLPGQPGRNKVQQRFAPLSAAYKKGLSITRISRRTFEVHVPFTEAEFLARREAWNQQQSAKRWLPATDSKPKEAKVKTRSKARNGINFFLRAARTYLVDEDDNLLFDEATICQFEQLASEMEALLHVDEPVTTSSMLTPDSRASAARNDRQLQALLRNAATNTDLARNENMGGL